MRASTVLIVVSLMVLGVCGLSPATLAAVRSCKAGVTGAITQAPDEATGKRKALESWTAKAAQFGPGYTSWRIAYRKVLGCKKAVSGGGVECIAYAAPCTIAQTPVPPDTPKSRLKKRGPNPAIDT